MRYYLYRKRPNDCDYLCLVTTDEMFLYEQLSNWTLDCGNIFYIRRER